MSSSILPYSNAPKGSAWNGTHQHQAKITRLVPETEKHWISEKKSWVSESITKILEQFLQYWQMGLPFYNSVKQGC